MNVIRKVMFSALLFFILKPASGQLDTCHLRISLLTCGPGEDLYSIWGHTGIRFIDSARQADVVFNYGTFDDSDPLFYIKFTRGMMLYSISPYAFQDFMEEYKVEKRSVTEQVLALTCTQKLNLINALWKNASIENKFYSYHFYADNCTTRARDIIFNNTDTLIQYTNIRPHANSTYRQLIHSYMNNSSQAWNRLAIDVLLGNHLDETMTNKQAMFLPDYLMKGFNIAAIQHHPLVMETNLLLPAEPQRNTTLFTPMRLFLLVLGFMIVLSFLKSKTAIRMAYVTDSLFFLLTGLLGLLMLCLWIFRIDNVCRNNYNLLWALPTHVVIAFVLNKQRKWVKYYFLTTAVQNAVLLISWQWLPQDMNNSVMVLSAILLFRSITYYRKFNRV